MSRRNTDWRMFLGFLGLLLLAALRFGVDSVEAARVSDIRGTKHNLSSAADGSTYPLGAGTGTVPTRNIKASSETQVCVFCHTPHAATAGAIPLWNRKVAGQGYTQNYILYDSSTLDAKQVQGSLSQPGGSSKLCLSCHDGTVAVGNVNVLNGQDKSAELPVTSVISTTGGTTMPTGAGAATGFTRNLGTNLSNDHPVSISYNAALVDRDGELRLPDGALIGTRSTSVRPSLPLERTGPAGDNLPQVQCASCHDPHIRETDVSKGNQKFLRLNRFQEKNPPSSSGFDATINAGDIICLACHDKNNGGTGAWSFSAHANPDVGDELYGDVAATRREFPSGMKVWQAACLNCHDTHTVQGARRLQREGTNEGISTLTSPKAGGVDTAAQEETCYQCHDGGFSGTLQSYVNVPNIKSDFSLARRMPITTAAQGTSGGAGGNASEPHDISSNFSDATFIDCTMAGSRCGKDFVEPRIKLGVGTLSNRHVECTDCHNPHRVIRAQNGLPGTLNALNTKDTVSGRNTGGGAHRHTNGTGYIHSNVISGVLRGSWGVEPVYGSASFHALPTGYDIKRGDPGNAVATDAGQSYVTREYQICLKCHSDYGYTDNNLHVSTSGNRPTVTSSGGTPSGTNGLTMYTNQAKEFQAPIGHRGEPLNAGTDGGCVDANCNGNNHRSWHPVLAPTGRSTASRGMSAGNPWLPPWNNAGAVGTQTMYCTDCHGSGVAATQSVIPDANNPWGPHGSNNNFILKGVWSNGMGATGRDSGETANLLCFKCHDSANYTTRSNSGQKSGFYDGSTGKGNLHNYHVDKIGSLYCVWCHVAVPHGWKNKALLVNLNDVGEEAGQGAGSSKEVAINNNSGYYSKEPYYLFAKLKVNTFATSGSWAAGNCGSRGKTGANLITSTDGANGGNTTGTGKNWMTSTCSGPSN